LNFKLQTKQTLGAALVLIGAICYSAKSVLVKLAYQHSIDAISLLTLRMIFALPFFLAVALYSGKKGSTTALSGADWMKVAVFGLLGYYLASLFDFKGLQYITASMERLILFVYPTMVVVISAIVYRRSIKKIQYRALILTYLGLVVTFLNDINLSIHTKFFLGVLMIFLSAFTYALYLVGSDRLIPKLGAVRYTAYAMSFAGIGVLLHYFITNGGNLWNFDPDVYKLSLMIAIISTVIPSFLVSTGIGLIGSGNASIIASIGPVSTILLSYVFLGEAVTASQIIGTVFVLGGVLMISLRGARVNAVDN
jgi:drug/metabolite transporter (DMT)-like permease